MSGFIKKTEVIKNSLLVIRLYGIRVYVACLIARKGETFLNVLIRCGKF